MSETTDPGLLKLVENIRNEVNKHSNISPSTNQAYVAVNKYPDAKPEQTAGSIGLIVDPLHDVKELVKLNKINPPDNLNWLRIHDYKALEDFLTNRGIPAYISFAGNMDDVKLVKRKDGYECAKLFVAKCKEAKLKELPTTECHSPVLSKRQQIELLLLEY
jgi:hypothetical protein